MADQFTPLPVKTKTAGDVDVDIVSGTVGRLEGGSIVITAGTVTTGSLSNVATVGTILNLNAGTVTVGNINNIGTLNVVEAGSINLLKAGTITKVEGGSILVTAGTITTGSLSNLATLGTIQNIVGGTVTVGNINNIGTVNVLEAGSLNLLKAGTITKLEGGTLGALAAGTVNVTTGSIVQTAGTVTTGSLSNVATVGTIKNLDGGTVFVSNFPGASAPKYSYQTVSSVAAGAVGTLEFGSIPSGTTGQLAKVILSSSVPIRGEIQTKIGTTPTLGTLGVMFSSAAGLQIEFKPPTDTYMTLVGTGTASNFRTLVTNNDNSLSADVYGVCFWDEITT